MARWLSIIYYYVNFQLLTVLYEAQSFACSVEGRVVTLLYLVSLAVGVTYVAKFKVARYPEFSRSTHLESKLIEFFVLVKF